jgi:hypothetical protein
MQRNVKIFWSPLLIGHALLSSHGSKQDAVVFNGLTSGMCG